MNNEVNTWADGVGRWYAEVPDTRLGLDRAIRAIALELFDRAPRGTTFEEMREYVEQNIVSVPSDKPGRVRFAEYAFEGNDND